MTRDRKEDSMSHVDEGTLHAYLDRELPSGEHAALEAHLGECATCRARLAEERSLFERASALLGAAGPAERPVPPFETVRRAPRRPWYARTSFAWAASIVLALGIGYYIRGPLNRSSPMSDRVSEKAESSRTELAAITAPSADAAPVPPAAPRSRAPAAPAPLTQGPGYAAPIREKVARPVDSLNLRGAAPPQLAVGVARESAASRRRQDSAALEEVVVAGAAPNAQRRAAAAAAAPMLSRSESEASGRNLVATSWPVISRGAAASLLGDRPVGVPGLAIRRIRRSPGVDSTIVVEQALDSGTVIHIFQQPAMTLSDLDAGGAYYNRGARARADRILARYVGRLRVEISGPVSTDSLNKLLEQVEPLP
jgi:hypothetical protein